MKENNEKKEVDVVLARFLNYMQLALYHKNINYFRDKKFINDYETSLETMGELFNEKSSVNNSFVSLLTEKEKLTLDLHFNKKLTYKEISKILKENSSTTRQRGHRAIEKLRKGGYHNG